MNNEQPYNINYTFHIQSAQDFWQQLAEHAQAQLESYPQEIHNTDLARIMLEQIGVRVET